MLIIGVIMIKLIKVLNRLVTEADYKTTKKKFLKQNAHPQEIKEYFELFRDLKNKNKIKNKVERNIDHWSKKEFTEFKAFVDDLKGTKTKSEEKKLKKMEGAELVAQNKDYYVYLITTHDAAMTYGSGSKWCITQADGRYWGKYSARNNFYFFIAKNKPKEDPLYKVAMTVNSKGKKTYWNALDHQIEKPPTQIDYTFESKVFDSSLEGILGQLIEEHSRLEEYYNTLEAHEDLASEYMEVDYKHPGNHLTDNAKMLVDELKNLIDNKDEFSKILIEECSELSLVGMYYATNEIASFAVGASEPEIDDEIKEDIENLTDEQKKELHKLAEDNGVYVDKRFNSYIEVGDYYNRVVAILDEDELEKIVNELKDERLDEEELATPVSE
jgi:hypothetical protein